MIQPETISPVIYEIFKWDCQLPFLPAGDRTLDYDIKHSEKCFNLTLLVIYKSGLKNTRFLLISNTTLYTQELFHSPSTQPLLPLTSL